MSLSRRFAVLLVPAALLGGALRAASAGDAAPERAAGGAVLDGIAAKVNADVITLGDVMNEIRRNPAFRPDYAEIDNETAMRRIYATVVNAMIDRKLILKAARDAKMELQDWVVENRVREIVKDGFGGDINKLNAALAESRVTFADWRTNVRDDLIVAAMRYQTIEKNTLASPGAMRAEYAVHPERYGEGGTVSVSVILLRPTPEGDTNSPSLKARGEALLARIDGGQSFAELAKAYSADSHAKDGGVWKDVKAEESFRPEIVQALAGLKVGEHSPLLDLGGWGFIVRKDAEAPARRRSFADAYPDIERNVRMDQARELFDKWVKQLRAEAYILVYPLPAAK